MRQGPSAFRFSHGVLFLSPRRLIFTSYNTNGTPSWCVEMTST
ncbi:unnamed protein product [Ectocarpus sp. 13 AM-2016]